LQQVYKIFYNQVTTYNAFKKTPQIIYPVSNLICIFVERGFQATYLKLKKHISLLKLPTVLSSAPGGSHLSPLRLVSNALLLNLEQYKSCTFYESTTVCNKIILSLELHADENVSHRKRLICHTNVKIIAFMLINYYLLLLFMYLYSKDHLHSLEG
jgi:hypothetical protein